MIPKKEIDILFPEQEIVINGEAITIRPYSWAKSMKAIQPLSVIMKVVLDNIDEVEAAINGFNNAKNDLGKIYALMKIANNQELEEILKAITQLMQLAIDKDSEYIESLSFDDGFILARAIYEVNKSFFKNRLTKMKKSSEKVKK
jgi:hypothetical protein